ncbi:MAG: DEAD/DEAH box helicase family protein [Candidatus Nitrosopolaris sp.]
MQNSFNVNPHSAISKLKFPFHLKGHQLEAVDAWISSGLRGCVIYSSGTGKTEIAFECARRAADIISATCVNILLLVPRIVLIAQYLKRLLNYAIPKENIGVYFGERKEIKEITISTYQSVIYNPDLIRKSKMVIFDEVHLASDTAKVLSRIFDIAVEDPNKALLGLTATINEKHRKYNTIVTVLPPVKKYMLDEAVKEGRLTKPVVIPLKVKFTEKEQDLYDSCSTKIKNISRCFKRYDATSMSLLLRKGGFVGGLARAWFLNVRKRRVLLSCAENKISAVVNLIAKKHPNQKVMVFSETLDSINKLRTSLEDKGIRSMLIDSTTNSMDRQTILSSWGKDFHVLLSIHTLEIGYDVPEVGIEIILATTSNMNQVIQRIGRVVRVYQGKRKALIYVVYISETKDDGILQIFRKAIELGGRTAVSEESVADEVGQAQTNKEVEERRIKEAYNILEVNSYESVIIETNREQKLFQIKSTKDKDKYYKVNAQTKTCTCPDFTFRRLRCKHIAATEILDSTQYVHYPSSHNGTIS